MAGSSQLILQLLADQRISVDESIVLLEAIGCGRAVTVNPIERLKKMVIDFGGRLVDEVKFPRSVLITMPFRDNAVEILNPYA